MARMKKMPVVLTMACLLASGATQASLIDRGGGLLYDDVLNVTWLQDANYAKTSGYDADGRMTWLDAKAWAANLSYYDSVRGVTYNGWRLPNVTPVGADWNHDGRPNGTTDVAYNITSTHSELSYMYYVNLGLKGAVSPGGIVQPDYGIYGNGTQGGQGDVGLVHNLQSYVYWSGTVDAQDPAHYAWIFATADGQQLSNEYLLNGKYLEFYAWAVRDGDAAAVPEPGSLILAGLGLAGLGWSSRRKGLKAS